MYEMLIFIFKAVIYRTVSMYLSELTEQYKDSTNTRLANDVSLLKLPTPSGVPYEWTQLDERVTRFPNFNMFKSENKTVLSQRYFVI